MDAMKTHIPSKMLKDGGKPWVKNKEVQRLMKRRKRAHKTSRRTKKANHRKRYQDLRNQVKQAIDKAHEEYVCGILNMENCQRAPRKFWSYIRGRGKDNVGVAPLHMGEDLATTGQAKAQVLSQ